MTNPTEPYPRPNNPWLCGGDDSNGATCSGPVAGRCSTRSRCHPIEVGGEWVSPLDPKLGKCDSGPSAGGSCCQGPGPCSPRTNWRVRRRAFTLSFVALTFAGLCFGLAPERRAEFLAPGPLTAHHAQVLRGMGIDRCTACHASATQSMTQWLGSIFGAGHHASTTQSLLCLKCHGDQIVPALALTAHNLEPAALDSLTEKFGGSARAFALQHGESIACSTCHREHHGADADLSRLTDRQCQTCHTPQFHSFETDHHEFPVNYPTRRRSRIAFDHVSHKAQHFVAKNRDFDCRLCHSGDRIDNVQTLVSYERACQECHDHQVLDSERLVLLEIPSIDVAAVRRFGGNLKRWPASAGAQFDGRISPLMRVLLEADAQVHDALDQLGPNFEFTHVDSSDERQVRLASVVAVGIEALVAELAVDPRATLRRRMAQSIGCAPDALALNDWLATAPLESLRGLESTWFVASESNAGSPSQSSDSSRWIPSSSDIMARYSVAQDPRANPQELDELVANPLTKLVQRSRETPQSDNDGGVKADPPGTALRSSPPGKLLPNPTVQDPAQIIPESELLAVNPLRGEKLLRQTESADAAAPPKVAPVDAAAPRRQDAGQTEMNPTAGGAPPGLVDVDGDRMDGWSVDPSLLTVSYKPNRHLDHSLELLLNLAASSAGKQSHPAVQQLFEDLTRDVGVGACGKCHTADRLADAHEMNWKATYRDPMLRGFTNFSHRPHLIESGGQACTSCHQLDLDRSGTTQFSGGDPTHFVGDFVPIRKAACAVCHQAGLAANSCTECHGYHVGSSKHASVR